MSKRIILDKAQGFGVSTQLPAEVKPTNLTTEKVDVNYSYDEEAGSVSFKFSDDTPVILKAPTTRQFLILEGFIKNADHDYRTEAFVALKLASLCIIKIGDKDKITFDELVDRLQFTDFERLAAGLEFFRDIIESVVKK